MPQSPLARSFQAATAHCHGLPAARSFARARRWTIARAEQGGESRHCFEPIGARRLEDFLIGHPWISLALSQDIVSTWQLWGEMKDSWKQVKKTVMNTSGKSIDAYIQLHIYICIHSGSWTKKHLPTNPPAFISFATLNSLNGLPNLKQ